MKKILFFLLPPMIGAAMMPVNPKAILNKDGDKFACGDGQGDIVLDFKAGGFVQGSGKIFTPMEVNVMERGDFYCITSEHSLWLLKQYVFIPADWYRKNKGGSFMKESPGITDSTPVMKFFHKGQIVYTITYRQLGFRYLNPLRKTPEPFQIWYLSKDVFIPPFNHTDSAAFVPQLTIKDLGLGPSLKIQVMTGLVKKLEKPPEEIVTPSLQASDKTDYMAKMIQYSAKLTELQNWYQQEVKSLNAKAEKLSDKELIQAMEKLSADHYRRLLKIQAEMPIFDAK